MIGLQNLILREVAHEDKAMFLICACTAAPQEVYEMYELHAGSREERVAWMGNIRDAINRSERLLLLFLFLFFTVGIIIILSHLLRRANTQLHKMHIARVVIFHSFASLDRNTGLPS